MKKQTVEKISVEEEEIIAQKIDEKDVDGKKEQAEESGPEGNLNDRRKSNAIHVDNALTACAIYRVS